MAAESLQETQILNSGPFSHFVVEKKGEKQYFVEGYAAIHSDEDLGGDTITRECAEDILRQMKERNMKADLEHETITGKNSFEKQINKTKLARAKFVEAFVDEVGIFARSMINVNHPDFKVLWKNIEDEFIDAYSIAYFPVKAPEFFQEGRKKRRLEKVNLFNIAFTSNPMHPKAKITSAFAKSRYAGTDHASGKPEGDRNEKPNGGRDMQDDQSALLQEAHKEMIEVKSLVSKVETVMNDVKAVAETVEKKTAEIKGIGEKVDALSGEIEKLKGAVFGKSKEAGGSAAGQNAEAKSYGERFETIEKNIADIKGIFESPMYKSMSQDFQKILKESTERKSLQEQRGPLDAVK